MNTGSLSDTIARWCDEYQNDNAHTLYVTDQALELFRCTRSLHGLSEDFVPVLEVAGKLHDLGVRDDPENHHLLSQVIIASRSLEGLSPEEVAMVAAVAGCHRKRVTPKDSRLMGLDPAMRKAVLKLASILRVADGLDYTHTQSSRLATAAFSGKRVFLYIAGPESEAPINMERATRKADLWQKVMSHPIRIWVRPQDPRRLVSPKESMAAAGKVIMGFHFERILSHEAGTRSGEDIEELHDMRVATRRLRAAFRVFNRAFDKEGVAPYLEDIRWLAAGLGAVRDLDVLLDFLKGYSQGLRDEDRPGISGLIANRLAEREKRRQELLALLDSDRYARFKVRFREFLLTPDMALQPRVARRRVLEEAPKALRQRLNEVLAYDRLLPDAPPETLHALRIAGKRFRYTCEFFQGAYNSHLDEIIRRTVEMQDLLGGIHDADVTSVFLQDYRESLPSGAPEADRTAILRLIEFISTRRSELLQRFHEVWRAFASSKARRQIQKTISRVG